MGDFEGAHVGIEQTLAPKELAANAHRLGHFAGANQGAEMAFRVAEVLRGVARLEVRVAGRGLFWIITVTDLLFDDDFPVTDAIS